MHRHNYNKMVTAGVANPLEFPEWQDKDGKISEEVEAYGCKVSHQITHPEYYVVMGEVGEI